MKGDHGWISDKNYGTGQKGDNNYCCCLLFCCFVVLRIQTKGFKQKDSNKSIQTKEAQSWLRIAQQLLDPKDRTMVRSFGSNNYIPSSLFCVFVRYHGFPPENNYLPSSLFYVFVRDHEYLFIIYNLCFLSREYQTNFQK